MLLKNLAPHFEFVALFRQQQSLVITFATPTMNQRLPILLFVLHPLAWTQAFEINPPEVITHSVLARLILHATLHPRQYPRETAVPSSSTTTATAIPTSSVRTDDDSVGSLAFLGTARPSHSSITTTTAVTTTVPATDATTAAITPCSPAAESNHWIAACDKALPHERQWSIGCYIHADGWSVIGCVATYIHTSKHIHAGVS